ncbi:endospore germination permease [Desulfosporosinus sp. PR]|uniref:GerAB/ArcD/ProY family transporter n=1 Tax=Candidatus Desulfosporosinus nitrosoreducens TaxID=3401928 RepID=UPI0027EAF2F5|nr:endospore germination permease [Desulfosporosinus sp. PR]MDQ7095199.1 endospore germination permease [Desulfosporosinus sp. PR]
MSERQLIGLIVIEVLATGLVYIPSSLLSNSGRDAYLTLLVSTVLSLPAVWLIGNLCKKHPQERALTIFSQILGKPLGNLIALGYAIFFNVTVLTIVVPGGEMIKSAFMPETPMFVLVFLLTCLAGYAAYLGLEPLARFNTFVIPLMILTFLVIGVANAKNFNVDQLFPPLEHGISPVLAGMITPIGWFDQVILALIFAPEVRHITKRTLLWTVILNAFALEYLIVVLILIMGPTLATFYEFPTLELTRIATVSGSIRGYDALVMTVWVTAVSVKAAVWIYAGIILLGDIFQLQSRRSLVPPLVILLSISAFPGMDNIREMSYYGKSVWSQYAVPTFEVGIPFLLYVLSFLKQHSPKS